MEEFRLKLRKRLESVLAENRRYNSEYLHQLTKTPGGLEYLVFWRLAKLDRKKPRRRRS